ncbi:hypothetical protein ZIOFF_034942 [Zingiber officinale]|uniref:Protein-serine/threonine kinase n=1 Tax=Zingiber officinale TaxID=94328 RepID=A0A8J5G969_ZINOF|nr:hypothetical protein ZIOFF_034942 [Zingiber officinale]
MNSDKNAPPVRIIVTDGIEDVTIKNKKGLVKNSCCLGKLQNLNLTQNTSVDTAEPPDVDLQDREQLYIEEHNWTNSSLFKVVNQIYQKTITNENEGDGIPRSGLPKIFTYLYSTAKNPLEENDEGSSDGVIMAGYGYGLPISRLYARYFGGDLQIISMEGYVSGMSGAWFIKRQKRTLFEVLEKVKAELMILGFISLLLTFSQDQIAKIYVPKAVADSMLPCRPDVESTGRNKRRLLALVLTESHLKRRILAAGDSVVECPPEKEQLITATGLHQLHILIFFLAEFHVVNSALIMVLGRAKIHRWKDWEKDTTSAEYAFTTEPVYRDAKGKAISKEELLKPKEEEKPKILIASIEFTNLKYSRVEIDEVRFEWAECMLDYI